MAKISDKKLLGITLCLAFGAQILDWLIIAFLDASCSLSSTFYNIYYRLYWAVINLLCCASFFMVGKRKSIFSSQIGICSTFALSFLYLLFAINNMASDNVLSFFGNASSYVFNGLEMFLFAGMLFTSKIWLPSKIVGVVAKIPAIVIGYFISVLQTYPESFDTAISNIKIWNIIGVFFIPLMVIVTIIWMIKKTPTSSYKQTPIDLI